MKELYFCYAREDKPHVDEVYENLHKRGLHPWMDDPPPPYRADGIPPGVEWDAFLRSKIKSAAAVLAFLSRTSVVKTGYVQKELRWALARVAEHPHDRPFLFPILLEPCEPPELRVDEVSLNKLQWVAFFRDGIDALAEHLYVLFGSSITQRADEPKPTNLLSVAVGNAVAFEAAWWRAQLEKKDEEISRLREDRTRAREDTPPVEAWHDPNVMKWWLAHRYDE